MKRAITVSLSMRSTFVSRCHARLPSYQHLSPLILQSTRSISRASQASTSPDSAFESLGQSPTSITQPGTADSYLLANLGADVDRAMAIAAQLALEKQRSCDRHVATDHANAEIASRNTAEPLATLSAGRIPSLTQGMASSFDEIHQAVVNSTAFKPAGV
ncbi:hypothetical protein BATDEDRAFT_35597 [Batrachochytrium dendrobatidis JAM81]|uniref:Uncharacterized protein n=2 Tax=Batrachochytrium dendrobatidis TaxID=109871 RepID=F4P7G4_BATDJ|nr:uncharacterized protein BATDEDRAFT_35597 [Batrachochytrium dendrobatidis JAM81]EGF79125.1 hypothetical protein BATDEDRAFT_35597 [Batrachochytrium dendrobatidis JAM81]KAJ8325107.1 hypothetical protein O5D80_006073 [Batrachochytrium dendrobatidis]KAK5667272.1 hypothetical protein QVD99_005887 [Batrachochytrium dendrobatidis]OAJ42109.1 hypothetical protein BDEG_25610 [Batrachochytrium dendrobatidis JEL423]|eukprot:XP_006680430.1 hypothetical protein BATDEDRAFT_35597 [Batrachochytrium dendrobatidis JAM81]